MDNENGAPANQPSKNRLIKANRNTLAARWNFKLLRGLQAALKKDPEADLSALLPPNYAETLLSHKRRATQQAGAPQGSNAKHSFRDDDIRLRLSATDPVTIIFELSPQLNVLLGKHDGLGEAIMGLLAESEILYESAWAASVTVFRVSKTITVKITNQQSAATELGSLLYLQEHLPSFPVPRPHGLVRIGIFCLLFTTFIPGRDLEKAWPQLDEAHKRDISIQLDKMLSKLRSLPCPPDTPLGGIQGEGCKDARRGLRINKKPIINVKQFEDFIFAGSTTASPLYIQFLRELIPASPSECVFTHGDIRPANIMVDQGDDGTWRVVAIIDWEASGFYPEYWESAKMTNNLTPRDNFDWYRYLPESLSPRRYPIQWLVDRLWDRNLVNS